MAHWGLRAWKDFVLEGTCLQELIHWSDVQNGRSSSVHASPVSSPNGASVRYLHLVLFGLDTFSTGPLSWTALAEQSNKQRHG